MKGSKHLFLNFLELWQGSLDIGESIHRNMCLSSFREKEQKNACYIHSLCVCEREKGEREREGEREKVIIFINLYSFWTGGGMLLNKIP